MLTLFGLCVLKYSVNTDVPQIRSETICPINKAYIVNPDLSNSFIVHGVVPSIGSVSNRLVHGPRPVGITYHHILIIYCCSSSKKEETSSLYYDEMMINKYYSYYYRYYLLCENNNTEDEEERREKKDQKLEDLLDSI